MVYNTGTVSGVLFNGGNLTGDKNVGGVVGVNDTNGTLTNSYSISANDQSAVGTYDMFFSHQINTSKADAPNKLCFEFVQGSSYDPTNPTDPNNPGSNNYNPTTPKEPSDPVTPPTYDIVDNPEGEEDHWDYLLDDTPWGRQRNFRERKAEIYFMDGAFWVDMSAKK